MLSKLIAPSHLKCKNPAMQEDGASYKDRIFRNYHDTLAKELGLDQVTDPEKFYGPGFRANFLPLLPQNRNCQILEVGCGRGYFLHFLKKTGYSNCRGIDVSPQMIRMAGGLGVQAEEAEAIQYLRRHPGQFDCVAALDVMEHMTKEELLDFMDAVYAALSPRGCFIAHTVNADGLSWGRMRYIDFTHETAFTRYSLGQIFKVVGFSSSEFHPTDPIATDFRSFLRKMLWKMFRLAMGLLYHAETGSGIWHNDHILTSTIIAKAVKSPS